MNIKKVFIWNKDIEPEIKEEIQSYLDKISWLIPVWCNRVVVKFIDVSKKNRKQAASIKTYYDYRFAKLKIYSTWLNQPPDLKLQVLIHEFIHIHTCLINDYAESTINSIVGDDQETFKDCLQDQLKSRNEQATEDLAEVIFNKIFT